MKRFFMKILLITNVFYFSDLYCMKKFLKRYCCCCCCCANRDDEGEFPQAAAKDFVEELKKLTPEEIDRQIEEFAQQVKAQPQFAASIEKLKEFFKKNRSKLKKWFAQHKKKK